MNQRQTDDYWQAYWGERFKVENEGYKRRIAALEAQLATAEANLNMSAQDYSDWADTKMELAAATEREKALAEALDDLMAVQNGAPLITWEDAWNGAMEAGTAALEAYHAAYLEDTEAARIKYDNAFGDERRCTCGHIYYRHFDWADNYRLGCKYCYCVTFTEAENTEAKQ